MLFRSNTTYIQFVLTDVEVHLGTDFAVLTCVENILTDDDDDEDDATTFAGAKGVATNIFRRTQNGWQLWVRHGSPVLTGSDDPGDEDDETP